MKPIETPIIVGDYEIKPDEHSVTRLSDQKVIRLSKSECLIIRILAEQPNVTVSRDKLLEYCWEGKVVTHSSLTVAIKHIRSAFAAVGETDLIVTEPRKGYLLRLRNEGTAQIPSQPVKIMPSANVTNGQEERKIPNKLLSLTKRYGIQTVFFLLTLFALSQYLHFIETTTINGVELYYDGVFIPQPVKKTITDLGQEHIEIATYPVGGLCSFYQLVGVTEDGVFDLTHFIEQGNCDDK